MMVESALVRSSYNDVFGGTPVLCGTLDILLVIGELRHVVAPNCLIPRVRKGCAEVLDDSSVESVG